jgi:N utilization substance protein B
VKRTELREHIFKMIFGIEFNSGEEMPEQMELYFEELGDAREKDLTYIREKAQNIASRVSEIDALIDEHTTGWKTSRMNKVDLTILRLAVYEIKWDDDVPTGVAIDEAVELAKKYSSDEGPAFINAVLAKVAA